MTLEGLVAPVAVSTKKRAAEILRTAIFDGTLLPGERLKEEELAKVWGISRTPIREALLILETEGTVESLANRGAHVRAYEPEELRVTYLIRAELEGIAAEIAASRLSPTDLAVLEESIEISRSLRDTSGVVALARENMRFHTTIVKAAADARLSDLVQQVTIVPMVYRGFFWYSREQRIAAEHYHSLIVSALRERDSAAARAHIREHVLESGEFTVARLRASATAKPGREPEAREPGTQP